MNIHKKRTPVSVEVTLTSMDEEKLKKTATYYIPTGGGYKLIPIEGDLVIYNERKETVLRVAFQAGYTIELRPQYE